MDLGLDAETAAQLRRVVAAKAAAVAAEDFVAAKRLKGVQDSIRAVGGSLAVLVADKAKAVRVRAGAGRQPANARGERGE